MVIAGSHLVKNDESQSRIDCDQSLMTSYTVECEREKRGRSPNIEKIRDCDGIFDLAICPFHASLLAVIDSSSFLPLICIILAFRFPRLALKKEGRPLAV